MSLGAWIEQGIGGLVAVETAKQNSRASQAQASIAANITQAELANRTKNIQFLVLAGIAGVTLAIMAKRGAFG